MSGRLRALVEDWRLARYLSRRCKRRSVKVCIRKSDGKWFVAGSPQNFAYAMRGLFVTGRCDSFHFYRARIWKGLLIVSPRIFWNPTIFEFDVAQDTTGFLLPAWPEEVECALIDANRGRPKAEQRVEIELR